MYPEDFETFWAACQWGEKGSKKKALDAWKKCRGESPPLEELLVIVKAQIEAKERKRRTTKEFVAPFQHVERWLKNRRWEDELDSGPAVDRDFNFVCECPACAKQLYQSEADKGFCPVCGEDLTPAKGE